MSKITQQLAQVQQRVQQALVIARRPANAAVLLAVSKKHSAEAVREAYACGQRRFGENYLQEALDKQQQLKDLDIEWHFIGPIQSNKTRAIAENFDWVHSVDRVKIAQRLNEQRPDHLSPLQICLQVNVDEETSKSGVLLRQVDDVVEQLMSYPKLQLRGLMAIPAARENHTEQYQALLPLTQKLAQLQQSCPELDTLSMGMSADLEAAIAAGSTMVRVGTDIFGRRH